jgi:hypothetical protein
MSQSTWRAAAFVVIVAASILPACRHAPPQVRFAPPGTDVPRLRSDFPLTDAERQALTPQSIKELTQAEVDQIYERLSSGQIPDGPFRGDMFFPRDANGQARLSDIVTPVPASLAHVATLRVERLGGAFWKGKVFFRPQGILRNRIEDLGILRPVIPNSNTIPKLTFDGQTTWLLFPAKLSCGESRLDPTRPSVVIDYARGNEVEGYRPIPDKIAGPEGLNIRDEVRIVRRGFYLGRAYFGLRFALNFTLLDPATETDTSPAPDIRQDCGNLAAAAF